MQIVIWKLGNLDHNIYPTDNAIDNLYNKLNNIDPSKTNHIIVGADVEVEILEVESAPQHILKDRTKQLKEIN